MTNVLKMSRKALTIGIVLTTILWSMMATALVAPLKASAAGCTSNTLIKGSLAAVYYCGSDGKRYVFANEKTYKTWYADFGSVITISDSDLASIQIGGNATYRPGVSMVKITTDPKVYAVAKGGVLRHVTSEAVAVALYGSTWNKMIHDVPDAFFTNYSIGSAIAAVSDYDKTAEMSASQNINSDKNLGGSTSTGTVNASLASDNPASATVPSGATSVNVLKFVLANNSAAAATVDSLTLKRTGPGAATDFGSVYLYEGSSRLTTGRSVNSSTNEVSFTGLGLALSAGSSRTLWVGVNMASAPGAGNVSAFQVMGGSAGAATLGGLPVQGSNFTVASASVGSLTIAKTGSITNPKVGQKGAKIAEFTLAAGSSEDVWVNRITLFQGGNLSGANLSNLMLKQAGATVATSGGFDAKLRAALNFAAPMKLEKGATKTFEVWGDIGGSARSADTLKIYVEEAADVYGTGATFGYGVAVTRTTYDGDLCTTSGGDCSFSTVEGGQITIAFNGPSSSNIASNGKDVVLFNFSLTSQGNTEVRSLALGIACGPAVAALSGCKDSSSAAAGNANYTDVKITNTATGQVWWGPQDLAALAASSDTAQTLTFTDVQNLTAGSAYSFKVTADVRSTVPESDTITVTQNAFGSSDLRNLDNSTFVATADIVPSGAIAGNQHTVRTPSLVVSLASTPVTQSFVKGSTNVPFLGLNLKAGDGANVKVTAITLTGFIDAVEATLPGSPTMLQGFDSQAGSVSVADDILSCKLMNGTTMVGDLKSPTTSSTPGSGGLLQFTSLNLTVLSSQTMTLALNCNISNSAFRNSNAEVVGFAVQAAADVTAQDPDGNNVVPTGTANATAAAVRIGIAETGTLTVAAAPTDTESEESLVVAGASNVVLGKYRLTAAGEELKLVKIKAAAALAAQDSITSVSLYDGSTLLAGPVALTTESASATAQFSGMNFVIPKDGSKTLTLKGTLNTISNGADTGDDLKMTLTLPGTVCTTAGCTSADLDSTSFEVRGTSSSTVIRQPTTGAVTAFLAGNSKHLRKTKPTISLASLPTTVMVNGGGVVAYRFTVTADAAENISLKKISFKGGISGTATVASPALREVGQGSDLAATGTSQTDGTSRCGFVADPNNVCVTVVLTSEQVVAAGTSKTFELRLTTSAFDGTDSLSTILLGDSANAVGELETAAGPATTIDPLVAGTGTTVYNFLWSDSNAIPHNDVISAGGFAANDTAASNDWANGYQVKVLPGDAQTLKVN